MRKLMLCLVAAMLLLLTVFALAEEPVAQEITKKVHRYRFLRQVEGQHVGR